MDSLQDILADEKCSPPHKMARLFYRFKNVPTIKRATSAGALGKPLC